MCGRFARFSTFAQLTASLGIPVLDGESTPHYNVAPGTYVLGLRRPSAEEPAMPATFWWGYKPRWAKGKASQPINARVETVATSGYFKSSFQKRRCVILADGWYEWDKATSPKQPYFFCREDRGALCLAAIYTEREDGSLGCAILTEPARGVCQAIHDRMPLLLDRESVEPWLDPDLGDRETLRNVIKHIDAELIVSWPVSKRINRPADEGDASLINPA
ncbi:MAG: SOS response-associated peptidase [Halomonas sp.]|nr:SOS response-associated peptidase [Halomonas sp.]